MSLERIKLMSRWNIKEPKKSIEWVVKDNSPHADDLEMAGFAVADTVKYGIGEDGYFFHIHHPVFPTLRCRPNDTHASYQLDIEKDFMPAILVNGVGIKERLVRVTIDGTLSFETEASGLRITYRCFPSTEMRAAYELVTVANTSDSAVDVSFTTPREVYVDEKMGCMGVCVTEVFHTAEPLTLEGGEEYTYGIIIAGRYANEKPRYGEVTAELEKRRERVNRLTSPMKIDSGCDILDTMFTFAKIRAGESVFRTKYGLMHSPGGYSYYAATWCNDEVEYAGPYFAYTGDESLIEASYNAYKMYMPFMSKSYTPIPSSVIAEGVDYWNGAGDRGDAAMYLYGASHFALTCADRAMAAELLPAIRWCASYCERKKNSLGVIESDSDELEERFPSGTVNLNTNTLCYAGLLSAATLEREIGDGEIADIYTARAGELRGAIDKFFAKEIHGLDTYRYHDGCEVLRSWICTPLCVGIYDRAEGTVAALCSEYLMTKEGFFTAEGCTTVWDRSTLYGLRGIFASGYTEKAAELLLHYSEVRLLGERVPYAVEAYPEGGRRHLSGESALFCKVITEGLLAMRPAGLNSFTIKPTLPEVLDHLYLTDIKAYGGVFNVLLDKDGFKVTYADGRVLASGKYGESACVFL